MVELIGLLLFVLLVVRPFIWVVNRGISKSFESESFLNLSDIGRVEPVDSTQVVDEDLRRRANTGNAFAQNRLLGVHEGRRPSNRPR